MDLGMILLLDKLKKLNPGFFHESERRYVLWREYFKLVVEGLPLYEDMEDLMQGDLQRTISTKHLHLLQSQDVDDGNYYAEISKVAPGFDGDCWNEKHLSLMAEGKGPSPCHALLGAYIACLEREA